MTGRHRIKTKALRTFKQQIELDVAIAFDTRIRRLSGDVSAHEGFHHVAFELLGVVEYVVIDTEHLRHAPSVVDVSDRAAARVRDAAPQFQGGADDLVPLVDEQSGRHRRVNATAHRYKDFHRTSLPARSDFYAPVVKR